LQDNDEQLRGVQDDGVQGSHARCGRSCRVVATGGSAREQRGHAWGTSETVEEKAADEIRRHCERLVEDLEVARCEQTSVLTEAEEQQHKAVEAEATWRGFDAQRKTGSGGRPALMVSQQMERAAELQNPEV
jgi:hypothetical protein